MNENAEKSTVRLSLLGARARMSADAKRDYSARICKRVLDLSERLAATHVFVYVALPDEVDTRSLIDALCGRGINVAVPRIVGKHEMRAVEFPGWDDMQPGPLEILAPSATVATAVPIDIAVVPGLGFAPGGARIGFGAGYYDRWLAQHPGPVKIGVAFESQIVASLPQEPHDIVMDSIVTEQRVRSINAA